MGIYMPSKSKSKGSRKKNVSKKTKVVQHAPVVEPVVEEASVVEPVVEEASVVEATPVVAKPVKQKGGSKRKGKKNVVAPVVEPVVVDAPTETEQVTEAFTEVPTETETSGRRTRSFKVLLPNSSVYEGR